MSKCPFILTRGKNKNLPCNRRCVEDGYCKNHKSFSEQGCQFILTRGNRKSEKCNKPIKHEGFCYAHSNQTQFNKCQSIICRGARKGQTCGRRCKSMSKHCTVHASPMKPAVTELTLPKHTCEYVYPRGPYKNKSCKRQPKENNMCIVHNKLIQNKY